MNNQVKDSTLSFTAREEGFRSVAYWDHKQWSIGYGSGVMLNGKKVKQGDKVTADEAWQMLRRDCLNFGAVVNRLVKVNLNQNQFDALVSFTYNLGEGNFSSSTLLKRVNENPNNIAAIQKEFKRWVYASNVINTGLVARRKREAELYASAGHVNQSFFFRGNGASTDSIL